MRIYRLVYLEGGPRGYDPPRDRIRKSIAPIKASVKIHKNNAEYARIAQEAYDKMSEEEKARYWHRRRPSGPKIVKWRIEYADVDWQVLEEDDTSEC